jgi:hypothetical protein
LKSGDRYLFNFARTRGFNYAVREVSECLTIHKEVLKDVTGKNPVPQIYDPVSDAYKPFN